MKKELIIYEIWTEFTEREYFKKREDAVARLKELVTEMFSDEPENSFNDFEKNGCADYYGINEILVQ